MKILTYPDQFLSRESTPVKVFNKNLRQLCQKMFELMYKQNGVGLSATQIGLPHSIVVVNPTKKTSDEIVLINPKIIKTSGKTCEEEEGCLSVPNLSAGIKRFVKITCQSFNLEGKKTISDFEGLLSRIIQHEIDHLNGILFIDRLPEDKRKLLLQNYLPHK
ncbi:MAG: peptide deformylase [Planctomycetota bacterium]